MTSSVCTPVLCALLAVVASHPSTAQGRGTGGRAVLNSAEATGLGVGIDRSGEDGLRLGATPDTTRPWRYFPLAVGNVWEYEFDGGLRRSRVTKDTSALGNRYFVVESQTTLGSRRRFYDYVRFDTASATVRQRFVRGDGHPDGPGEEDVPYIDCPLDAPFGEVVTCGPSASPSGVRGGYDGALVFGGERAGTGPDTVRTSVKVFSGQAGFETTFAAGVGVALEEGDGYYEALRYYRVDGVEHGATLFPTGAEGIPTAPPRVTVAAWPNPASASVSIRVEGPSPGLGEMDLQMVDVLGRVVGRKTVGAAAGLVHRINLTGLAPGLYVIHVSTPRGELCMARLTVIE